MAVIPGSNPSGSLHLTCPHCGKDQLRGRDPASQKYECRHCGKSFTREQAEQHAKKKG
jgi:transposase-like protein